MFVLATTKLYHNPLISKVLSNLSSSIGNNIPYGIHTLFAKDHDRGGFYSEISGNNTNNTVSVNFASTSDNVSVYATSSGLSTNLNTWIHVAYVIGNGQVNIYRNGTLTSSTVVANPLSFTMSNTKNLYFGKLGDNYWYPLNGKLDDIRIYNRALTTAEVQALANQ